MSSALNYLLRNSSYFSFPAAELLVLAMRVLILLKLCIGLCGGAVR